MTTHIFQILYFLLWRHRKEEKEMPTKSCLNCGYRALNPQQCPLISYQYADDRKPVCPYWIAEVPKCDLCGQVDPKCILTQATDESWKRLCEKCSSRSGTCGGCKKSQGCDFETNPSPLPKAVQKRIQQGNQIIMATVKNKDRIRETCQKNCDCWDENFGCLRENGTCGKYEDNL